MAWSASVLSTISSDTEPTIIIKFDSAKYIFNAGENLGRSWLQSRANWKKTRGLFLTSLGTQRGSGVPGLMMLLADASIPKVDVVGPPGLLHFLAAMRSYLYREKMVVCPTELDSLMNDPSPSDPTPVYKDENIRVYAIPLLLDRNEGEVLEASDSDTQSDSGSDSDAQVTTGKRKRSSSPPSSSKRVAQETPLDEHQPLGLLHVPPSSSLEEQASVAGFSPSTLIGSDAQDWRRFNVENSFSNPLLTDARPRKVKPPKEKKKKVDENEKGKGKVNKWAPPQPAPEPSSDGKAGKVLSPRRSFVDRARHPYIAAYREKQLPIYQSPYGGLASKQGLCYIIEGPRTRGKFDVKKAEALGLGPGPLRAKITRGQTVSYMVDDGQGGQVERVVKPEDCLGPTEPPHVAMVFDVPTPAHIPLLVSAFDESPFYSRLCSKREEDRNECLVHAIFHLCGDEVLEDSRYKQFMNRFSDEVHHVISSRRYSPDPITFTSAAFNQLRLNQLDSEMFPVPKFNPKPEIELSSVPDLPANVSLLRANTLVPVRPPRPPMSDHDTDGFDQFHPIVLSSEPIILPSATTAAYKGAQVRWEMEQGAETRAPKPGDDVEILPLGTSSALPSKYRNVSSTFVRMPNWGNLLLDCGEGTWGQLARFYGNDPARSSGVWQILRDLKCIFVSHMHGDHHIGLAKILAMRKLLDPPPKEPVYVVGLRYHILYLRELSDLEDLGVGSRTGVVPILSDHLPFDAVRSYGFRAHEDKEHFMEMGRSFNLVKRLNKTLGLKSFQTISMSHKTRCYGVSIQHKDGWKLIFSADTMPCKGIVKAGKGATLLIHEATMADDNADQAKEKAHSTCGQAVNIGTQMGAENILLTHFSARYPKMPPSLTEPQSPVGEKAVVGLAFDHALVRIGDMRKLRAYLPAIEQCFADTAEEGDEDNDPSQESW